MDSALGQPLRASIAYALAPNEQMFDYCIFLNPARSANGLPVVSNARVTVTENAIVLNGRIPVREPLLTLQVSVNCAYTAHLAREYMLMIDPPLASEGQRAALGTERPALTAVQTAPQGTVPLERETPAAVKPAPIPRRAARRPQDESPIPSASSYRVQPGDSLSQIAARIENRNVALWPAVNAIFAANPQAFLDNDPNLLKAGSLLEIPDFSGELSPATRAAASTAPAAAAPRISAYNGAPLIEAEAEASAEAEATPIDEAPAVAEPVPQADPIADVDAVLMTETELQPVTAGDTASAADSELQASEEQEPRLRPGDFVIGTDNPFVVPLGSDDPVIDIPDTDLRGPQASQPVSPVAVAVNEGGGISNAWAWLLWLGGAGIAMILGLFLFGRQLREYFGPSVAAMPPLPQRRRDDSQPPPSLADIDYNFDATTITGRKISLDADLDDGSGLNDSDDMDVAQDFAYSAKDSQVEVEIPELPVIEDRVDDTGTLPAAQAADIVDAEVLPVVASDDSQDDDEEDYSVSMNVDATKQILDDNTATAKDLQAVLVDTNVDISADDTGEYTLSRSAEYQILEQDYEEELTATQALNKEIEEAARALAEQMDGDGEGKTSEMPVAQDPTMTAELTANLETQGDAQNEEYAATGTVTDELKVEMPDMGSDETLDVESPMIEEPSKKAS